MSQQEQFRGREEELEQFKKVLADPAGQAVVIEGEAGTGKSLLLRIMVTSAIKSSVFHCEGNIYPVVHSDNPSSVLRKVGRWGNAVVVGSSSKSVVERLAESVEEFGDVHRRVVGIDALPVMNEVFLKHWLDIVANLPDKVKFIFTQRPDGILASNKEFMSLPNVVRIPAGELKLPEPTVEQGSESDEWIKSVEHGLRAKFLDFLKRKKDWPEEAIDWRWDDPLHKVDLILREPNTKRSLALVDFKHHDAVPTIGETCKKIREVIEHQSTEGIRGYVVYTSQTEGVFEICGVSEAGKPVEMKVDEFPDYKEPGREASGKKSAIFKFRSGVDLDGSDILNKIVNLVGDSNFGLYVEDVDESYVNLRLEGVKETDNIAVQIHKYGENETVIALAIAGPRKGVEVPEPKLNDFIDKGKITELSGYKKSTPMERAWLNGNSPVRGAREKVKVYVIQREIVNIPELWNTVEKLLGWAVDNFDRLPSKESGKVEVESEAGSVEENKTLQSNVAEKVKVKGSLSVEILGGAQPSGMSFADHCVGDSKTDKDKLGFRPYVEAVARFLTHEKTELPLTLSVEGEWGSGKSSFLSQLKNEIGRIYKDKGQERAFIVEFDPWRHDKDEALWAAFALKFIGDASKCLTRKNRLRANRNLWKERYRWKQAWPDLIKMGLVVAVWLIATIVICIGLWNAIKVGESGTLIVPKVGGGLIAGIVAMWFAFGKVKDFVGSPLDVDLRKYMKKPDYASRVSFIEKFHSDFKDIIDAYAGSERVYVFIDDLDRCEVPKAAELMESINLMISDEPKLVFIMGMDREKVAAGLAVKHEKLLPYLAETVEKRPVDEEEAKQLRGIRYGFSFIEKFIQVPFRLPRPNEKRIEELLLSLTGQLKGEEKEKPRGGHESEGLGGQDDEEVSPPLENVPPSLPGEENNMEEEERAAREGEIDAVLTLLGGDNEEFRSIVLMVSKAFDYNPRRAKQFVNIFRLRAAMAKVTGLFEATDGKRLTFEQLGKFVGIGLGWPLLIRDIERKPGLLKDLAKNAEGDKKVEIESRYERWANESNLTELLKAGKGEDYSLKDVAVEKLLEVSPGVAVVAPPEARSEV